MKLTYTLTLVCVACWLHAQITPAIQWQKPVGGSFIDETRSICKTYGNGFVLTGFTLSTDGDISLPKAGNGWVIWMDSAGNIQHQFTIDADLQTINQTSDTCYFITGSKMEYHANGSSSYDFFLMKMDTTGNIIWQHTYGGSNIDYAKSACATVDGGYIITGFSQSADGDVTQHYGSSALPDFWIVKTDKDGDLQWQKTLGGDNFDDAFSIKQTSDNGYIIAGRTNSTNGNVTAAHYDNEFWLVKLSAAGNLQWQQTYGGSKSDIATQVVITNDGGYMLAGYSNSSDGDVTGNYGSTDVMIIKTDANGKLQWCKTLGGSKDEFTYNLRKTIDGNFIVAASTNSKDYDLSAAEYNNMNYWIVKLTDQGNLLWQHTYGGSSDDGAYDIINTHGEDYLVAGNSHSNDGNVSGNHNFMWDDIWLLKLFTPELPPVSITDFDAVSNNENVDLSWTSTHENYVSHYIIQKSTNGINFTEAATVTSAQADSARHYFYIDSNAVNVASADTLFYRIAAVNNVDSFVYSRIDTVLIIADSVPVTNSFTLKFFKANISNSAVDVSWKVAHETAMKQYIVQRSTDSITFTDITILPSLQSDTAQLYVYTDTGILNTSTVNTLYYRTAAIDVNDIAIYTNIDAVHRKEKDSLPANQPLMFTAFKAAVNNNDVDVLWKSKHDVSIKYYIVQRSTDSIHFTNAGRITSFKADKMHSYFFTDINVIAASYNKLYYRAAAVDMNDSITYSNTDIVHRNIKDSLPVQPFTFKAFKAVRNSNDINVSWKSLHEADIKYYIIQRSTDNIHFIDAYHLASNNNNDAQQYYLYTDKNIATSSSATTLYYRALAVIKNDVAVYSKTDSVRLKKSTPPVSDASFSILIGPNPVHDILKISVSNYNGKLSLSITDEKGKLLLNKSAVVANNADISIPFYSYAGGAYFVNIYANGVTIKKKIIKQ